MATVAAAEDSKISNRSSPEKACIPNSVLLVLIVAFLVKCAMALFTYGTLDVTTWRMDVAAAKSVGVAALYREGVHYFVRGLPYPGQLFSHPPSMIHILRFWDALETLTRLPLQFWMRFFCALADVGTVLVVWRLSLRSHGLMIDTKMLILLAACPILIMVSGFHGNTDPIMVFLLAASVYFVETGKTSRAALLFGLALCIKIVPALFGLCFLLRIGNIRTCARFIAIVGTTFAIAGMPYWISAWSDALHIFSSYNSSIWISTLAFQWLGVGTTTVKIALLLGVVGLSVWMNSNRMRTHLFIQVGTVTALFLAVAPGFGVQYFSWGVPWVVVLGVSNATAYYLLPGSFMARLYTVWCSGVPWYAADDTSSKPGMSGAALLLFAWLAVWWTLFAFIRQVLKNRRERV
jgi:hypothetical protein